MRDILFLVLGLAIHAGELLPQTTLTVPQSTLAACACSPCHCQECTCAGGLCSCTGCGLVARGDDTYAQAHAKALQQGKPLVVWVGGNFCERCVEDSKDEFIHHFAPDGWQGNTGQATVIYVPHQGSLWRAGTVNRWTVGSHDWGHVPSARRVVAEWRAQAKGGSLTPLRLLDLNGGEAWGMSHDVFWRNHQGGSAPRQSIPVRRVSAAASASGGNC